MYQDPRAVKSFEIKFKIDDFDREHFEFLLSLLAKKQSATLAREFFQVGLCKRMKEHSIHVRPEQEGIFNEHNAA